VTNLLKPDGLSEKRKENLFTAIYIGAVFIIIAAVYVSHLPNSLWDELVDFFTSLTLSPIPGTSIPLPAPSVATAHTDLFFAVFQFAIALGALEIVILFLRIYFHSPIKRKAETIENIVFWLGTSYLAIAYLVNINQQSEWFVFWAGVIMTFGLALVVRAFILLAKR
jgi:tellurite resistance protein TehA-like permease